MAKKKPCVNCGGPEGYPSDHAVGCPLRERIGEPTGRTRIFGEELLRQAAALGPAEGFKSLQRYFADPTHSARGFILACRLLRDESTGEFLPHVPDDIRALSEECTRRIMAGERLGDG